MTTPNIRTASTITAGNAVQLADVTATAVVSNASTSNKLQKISVLSLCNVSASTACAATVAVSNGTTAFNLLAGVTIYNALPRIVISRENPVYLTEGDSLVVSAASSGYIEVVCGYEEVQ